VRLGWLQAEHPDIPSGLLATRTSGGVECWTSYRGRRVALGRLKQCPTEADRGDELGRSAGEGRLGEADVGPRLAREGELRPRAEERRSLR
jgi:hypothetical protein